MCIPNQELTPLDVYHRILRFNNYLVAMVNKVASCSLSKDLFSYYIASNISCLVFSQFIPDLCHLLTKLYSL